jgi:hypothetical protein
VCGVTLLELVLECENLITFMPSKAVLKRPQSPAMRDWRDFPTAPNARSVWTAARSPPLSIARQSIPTFQPDDFTAVNPSHIAGFVSTRARHRLCRVLA